VAELGLAETVKALRAELEEAVAIASGEEIRFAVGPVQMEFHVCVRREGGASGKARFWVLEAGADSRYSKETIQRVTLTLQAVTEDGEPIHIRRGSAERP
jgi:Trypsin-co-occurring domain 2